MYGRPGPPPKRCSPGVAKDASTPVTLKDLGRGGAAFAPRPRAAKDRQAPCGLGQISEAAEWADESSCVAGSGRGDVDEFEELWADVEASSSTAAPVVPSASSAPSSGSAVPKTAALLQRYGGGAAAKASLQPRPLMPSTSSKIGAKAPATASPAANIAAQKDADSDKESSTSEEMTDEDSDDDVVEPSDGPGAARAKETESFPAVPVAEAVATSMRPRRDRVTGLPPVARASRHSKEPEIRKVFEEIDVGSRGSLSLEDVRSYLCDYLGFGQAEADSFFEKHGSQSGISFEAFQAGYASLNPFMIMKRCKETIIRKPGSLNGRDISLEVEDCDVYVCDVTAQIFVDDCKRSKIMVAPCESSVFVRDCQDCTFWIAAQQLRTRDCKDCTFHIYSKTEPIIESSSGLSFSPWCAEYPKCSSHFSKAGFDPNRNLWNAVFDFSGKKDKCNWRITPLEEVQPLSLQLDEPTSIAAKPDNPVPAITHSMLCAEPLTSGESCGQGVTSIPQTRPALPAAPSAGASPKVRLVQDAARRAPSEPNASKRPSEAQCKVEESSAAASKTTAAKHVASLPSKASNTNALLDVMGAAVKKVEDEVDSAQPSKASVGARAMSSRTAPQTSVKAKPPNNIFARTDLVDNALKKASEKGPAAKAPSVTSSIGSLAGLRMSYSKEQSKGSSGRNGSSTMPAKLIEVQEQPETVNVHEDDEAALEEEWDSVAVVTEEMRIKEVANRGKVKPQDDIMSKAIVYSEVELWLVAVSADADTRCKDSMTIPGLDSRFVQERNLVFALKGTDFDFNTIVHFRMLKTMYTKLTRSKMCPSIGGHWEVLGFQGGDPRTDLNRSGGVLNVALMFYVFAKHPELMRSAFVLSQDTDQNFPLACVSINITKLVIDNFSIGNLSTLCNSTDGGVFEAVCDIHASAFHHFYSQWRSQKRTIKDTDMTFKEIRSLLEHSPEKLLEDMAKAVISKSSGLQSTDSNTLDFTDLSLESAAAPVTAVFEGISQRLKNYQDGSAEVQS